MNATRAQGLFFPGNEGVRRAAEAVSHTDLGWFFEKYVAGTEEIPWDDFFRSVGLHLAQGTSSVADPGFVAVRNFDAALVVAAVTPGSAAEQAGLATGDSILEINGHGTGDRYAGHFAGLRPGETVRLRVRNSEGERELQWVLGTRQELEFTLVDLDKVSPDQKARRSAWVRGEVQMMAGARP